MSCEHPDSELIASKEATNNGFAYSAICLSCGRHIYWEEEVRKIGIEKIYPEELEGK